MNLRTEQLSRHLDTLKPLSALVRPSRGWIRAIREALGMTTRQLAERIGIKQPSLVELEKGEATGNITMQSLERAAEALGCRLVYAFVPIEPLPRMIEKRASQLAERKLASIRQTMRLEAQEVHDTSSQKEAHQRLVEELLRRPARLWDEP